MQNTTIHARLLVLLLVFFSASALANYKCTDSNGRNSYQEQPCKSGTKQQTIAIERNLNQPQPTPSLTNASATSLIVLEKAEIFQEGPNPASGFTSFTLRAQWTNRNKTKVRVNYKVRFLDSKGVELYVDSRYRDIEASSSTTAPQVLATFNGKPSDSFKYKDASSATITFTAQDEKEEKVLEKIRINRP